MKIHPVSMVRRHALLTAALLLAALPARADFVLDFDYLNDNANLSANTTYVTFLSNVNGTINGAPIVTNISNALSQSYSIADVIANGGFHFANPTTDTVNFYISYGNSSFFNNSTSQPNPGGDASVPRYSVVEMAGGGGDLTQINQFGGSLRIDDYNYSVSNTTPVKSTYNSLTSAQTFGKIYNNIGANISSPVVITQNVGGQQQFMRIIGPSTGSFATSYPAYTSYLTSLHNNNTTSQLKNDTVLDGPIGLRNAINSGNGNYTVGTGVWNAAYAFNATVDAGGNIVYNGTVTFTGAANTTGNVIVYNGLYIIMPNDGNLTSALYGMSPSNSTIYGVTPNATITDNGNVTGNSSWAGLNDYTVRTDSGNTYNTANDITLGLMGNTTINLKITGDFEEGLATGFVGSPTYGNLSSAQWWALADKAYLNGAQPDGSTFFNLYGSAIFGESATTLNGTTIINGGAVYSSPYDDRFNSALLNADDKWVVSILPDGNLAVSAAAVPEPGLDALLASAGALAAALYYRRKTRRSPDAPVNN